VHKTIQNDIQKPYFILEDVNSRVDQSRSAIHYHMKELVDRGYLIQVGRQYVDALEVQEWELWQISRLIDNLSREQKKAHKLSKLRKEKKEIAKEQLEELKEQASNRWCKRQTDRLKTLEESKRFYERKAELMDAQAKALTRFYFGLKAAREKNSEKSESPDIRKLTQPVKIPS